MASKTLRQPRQISESGTYSIVLLTIVDSDYKFVVVDIGAYGKQSDGGILQQSQLQDLCVFVGNEAFQLRPDFLRPCPRRELEDKKRIFNYRLSRTRRAEMTMHMDIQILSMDLTTDGVVIGVSS
ncbi:hypothetical protein HPB49_003502 [Dermacentor silvarum]|uniref:Uncharacterized protein n=1 Tax=Dermacentor silvarum TaxID=543639 RepID=A0ACB8DLY7_DERSI|nr:hypothetical protein HPB49_003502 [Dermacentor silvarum]